METIIDLIEILPGDDTVQCPLEVDSIADGGNQQQKADDSESRLDWMVCLIACNDFILLNLLCRLHVKGLSVPAVDSLNNLWIF